MSLSIYNTVYLYISYLVIYLYLHHVFHADSSCSNYRLFLSLYGLDGIELLCIISALWELWMNHYHLSWFYCYKYNRFISLFCQNQHPRHHGVLGSILFHWCITDVQWLRSLRPDRRWPSAWRFCSPSVAQCRKHETVSSL